MSKKTSERVRVGIVGGGRIADLNKIGWLEHDCAVIVAACDVDDARRQARADEWKCKAYAELDDMRADPEVDAIEILTPEPMSPRTLEYRRQIAPSR